MRRATIGRPNVVAMPIDASKLLLHLGNSDAVTAVLKGHLWLEGQLRRLLELKIEDPSAIDLDRLKFSALLTWNLALGGITPDYAPWLRSLNRLRNELAHSVDAEPTPEWVDRLRQLSDHAEIRDADDEVIRGLFNPDESSHGAMLRWMIVAHVAAIEGYYGAALYHHENQVGLALVNVEAGRRTARGEIVDEQVMAHIRAKFGVPPPPSFEDTFAVSGAQHVQ